MEGHLSWVGGGGGGGALKVENGRIRSAENLFSQTCGTEGQSVCRVKDPVQSRCSTQDGFCNLRPPLSAADCDISGGQGCDFIFLNVLLPVQ